MGEWRYRDTLGIVVIVIFTFNTARTLDGITQVLMLGFSAVIALLLIAKFFFEGYTYAAGQNDTNP